MFEEFQKIIVQKSNEFIQRDLLPEAVGLVAIIISGLILSWILRFVLKRMKQALEKGRTMGLAPWLQNAFDLLLAVARPLSIWFMGKAVIRLMINLEQPHGILEYLLTFAGLWLVYRILSVLIDMLMDPDKINLWKNQILRPTFIILAFMQVGGLLDSILDLELNLGKGVVVTVGALLGALVVVYIFILLGRYVRGLLRDVILPRMDADPSIIPIVATFGGYVVIFLGLIFAMLLAGIDLTAMAVILGGFSVGIGFGMQQLVNNFISGFILLFERSLVPGRP